MEKINPRLFFAEKFYLARYMKLIEKFVPELFNYDVDFCFVNNFNDETKNWLNTIPEEDREVLCDPVCSVLARYYTYNDRHIIIFYNWFMEVSNMYKFICILHEIGHLLHDDCNRNEVAQWSREQEADMFMYSIMNKIFEYDKILFEPLIIYALGMTDPLGKIWNAMKWTNEIQYILRGGSYILYIFAYGLENAKLFYLDEDGFNKDKCIYQTVKSIYESTFELYAKGEL